MHPSQCIWSTKNIVMILCSLWFCCVLCLKHSQIVSEYFSKYYLALISLFFRCLLGNCTANVELTFERPICIEVYEKCKPLGRFMLRVGGESIAGGTVTKVSEKYLFNTYKICLKSSE